MAETRRLLTSRGTAALLSVTIGSVSAWLLVLNSIRIYVEYYVYPRAKAADGYYYPQWRYTVFDAVLLAWCVDGLVAAVLLFRSIILGRSIAGWAGRTTLLFFAGFGVLVLGVVLGTWLRTIGV